MTVTIDIGGGHTLEPTTGFNETEVVGYIDRHFRADNGEPCRGYVNIDPEGDQSATWQVVSVEPLTLSPSLLCRACGDHGFIRDGKWVPA